MLNFVSITWPWNYSLNGKKGWAVCIPANYLCWWTQIAHSRWSKFYSNILFFSEVTSRITPSPDENRYRKVRPEERAYQLSKLVI